MSLSGGATLSNAPAGTFDCVFDGTMNVDGTALVCNAGLFRKAAGNAQSSLSGAFANTGSVELQSGTLNFSGTYIQTAGATTLKGGNLAVAAPLQIAGASSRAAAPSPAR